MIKCAAFAFSLSLSISALAAEEPPWLKEARAREGTTIKPVNLKSKDGWFKARVPAKVVNSIEMSEGSYTVELEFGGGTNMLCEVYPKGIDLANSLRITLETSM